MKAGFSFLEAGAVRRRSVVNTLFRNFMDLCRVAMLALHLSAVVELIVVCFSDICGIAYWLFGYALAFGNAGNPFIGHNYKYFALAWVPYTEFAMWFFQMVFGEAAATIVSGAIAERANSLGYMIANFLIVGKHKVEHSQRYSSGRRGTSRVIR